jgi:hypothetical protein
MDKKDLPTTETAKPENYDQWEKDIMKKVQRLFNRQSKNMTDNNQTTDGLLLFLDAYPELFADKYGMINRDMIKWALHENIKKNRELIDKIQEIEKELNLEIHHEW